MRNSVVAGALCLSFTCQQPPPLRAGAFATEITQILNHGELVAQYIQQGQHLAEALKQTMDMVRNSKNLSMQMFGPIMSDITQLASVVQGGMGLAYSMA